MITTRLQLLKCFSLLLSPPPPRLPLEAVPQPREKENHLRTIVPSGNKLDTIECGIFFS